MNKKKITEAILKKAKLPSLLKIGYQNVKVKEVDHKHDEKLGDMLGCYIGGLGEIRISSDQIVEEKCNTVIHEVLHAAFKVYGMREIFDEKREELIINTFANALTQVLRDNPDLLTWIKDV